MKVNSKSTIITVAIPNDLFSKIKAEAERRKIGYSTYVRILVAKALSEGDKNASTG
jgi:predicted DNA binding CopG/RHH family protein